MGRSHATRASSCRFTRHGRPRPLALSSRRAVLSAHVVWATVGRAPLLPESADAWLARVLACKAHEARAALLASGCASDHVHVLVRFASTVALSAVVHRLKGASSRLGKLDARLPLLRWQQGFWASSIGLADLDRVSAYVRDQRAHHERGRAREAWELATDANPRC